VLQDYNLLENAIGARLPEGNGPPSAVMPTGTRAWFYRFALQRGYLDSWLTDYIARPVLRLFHWADDLERRWTDFLSAGPSRESDRLGPSAGSLEDLS
jgi:NAD(P)H-quinone oxidoreductase subunit 5